MDGTYEFISFNLYCQYTCTRYRFSFYTRRSAAVSAAANDNVTIARTYDVAYRWFAPPPPEGRSSIIMGILLFRENDDV